MPSENSIFLKNGAKLPQVKLLYMMNTSRNTFNNSFLREYHGSTAVKRVARIQQAVTVQALVKRKW